MSTEGSDEVRLVAMTRAQVESIRSLAAMFSSASRWNFLAGDLWGAFEDGITEEEARSLSECVGYALGNGMSKRLDIDAAQKLGAAFPAIPESNAFQNPT